MKPKPSMIRAKSRCHHSAMSGSCAPELKMLPCPALGWAAGG